MSTPATATGRRAGHEGTHETSRSRTRSLSVVLALLGVGMGSAALLGPLALEVMQYRTSPTTLNQLLGVDATILFVLAPLTLVTAVLAGRGHQVAPPLASGLGVFAVYTYAQAVIGQEYLDLPGNVERFFPLLLAVFVLGGLALVLAWHAMPPTPPEPSPALQRVAAWVLLLLAAFLVVGLHLPTMLTAWTDPQSMTEYASAPTPFWMVKLMDLGIIVPVALGVGWGLLHGADWALRVMYPLFTGYTCLALSVTGMAFVMLVKDDPDASLGLASGFAVFALGFLLLTVRLYRPLMTPGRKGPTPD